MLGVVDQNGENCENEGVCHFLSLSHCSGGFVVGGVRGLWGRSLDFLILSTKRDGICSEVRFSTFC